MQIPIGITQEEWDARIANGDSVEGYVVNVGRLTFALGAIAAAIARGDVITPDGPTTSADVVDRVAERVANNAIAKAAGLDAIPRNRHERRALVSRVRRGNR